MTIHELIPRRLTVVLAAGACISLLTACGATRSNSGAGAVSAMRRTADTSMAGMTGTNPAHTSARLLKVDGITPIPTQMLTTADWQDMKVQAMAMTAVPFVVYNGTREQTERMPRHVSFHLMVNLTDARSHEPIPYASVWATITRNGKVVYDARQWPMIAEYLGPHYGDNVALPGPGHYRLSLLISPPVAARHIEYKNIWLKPHRLTASFTWTPPRS